jgi:hypothetical protein
MDLRMQAQVRDAVGDAAGAEQTLTPPAAEDETLEA